MANLQCAPATNITTQESTMPGSGDFIPANHFLRIAFANASGGPYTGIGSNTPGNNTVGQTVSATEDGLSSASTAGATYYYVVQELDTDGSTVLDESDECSFTTLPYSPRCRTIGADEGTITIEVCADFVNTDQQLQAVYGNTPGGPYNTVGGTTAGTYTLGQCQIFVIPVTPCDILYFKARVTPVPANYEVDWQYNHGARNTNQTQEVELRLGDESDYPANQVLVDSDTIPAGTDATDPGDVGWHVRSGTFPLPAGINQLHMGFVSTEPPPPSSIGNFIDECSIVLRRTFPTPAVIGEQLINGSFEDPDVPTGGFNLYAEAAVPGWETSAADNVIEMWDSGFLGHSAHSTALAAGRRQFCELNANLVSELFQVVQLAVGTADSELECPISAFLVECDPATDVDCSTATLNGHYCGVPTNYWVAFQIALTPTGPWNEQTPLIQSFFPQEAFTNISYGFTGVTNTTYYYRLVVLDENQDVVATSEPVCSFTTDDCFYWCGGEWDSDSCTVIDPGNGEPYRNCWPQDLANGFPGEGVNHG